MTTIYFFLAAVALGVLVLIHELGHYIAAKAVGMTVKSFSIGFGPAVFRRRINGVEWRIGLIPFGGYVKIAGMDIQRKGLGKEIIDPYEVQGGFFSKSPWKRIVVLLAGPAANIVLALGVFWGIGALGGRTKSFSEFTQVVGWVNPESVLYNKGLRAGDVISSYNGRPYRGGKDLMYITVLGKEQINLTGFRPGLYRSSEKKMFNYVVTPHQGENATSVMPFTGGSYLIYDGTPLPEGSPMRLSGILPGDQIVWMDGEFVFSMEDLSGLLNSNYSLLTVERDGKVFLTREKRVLAGELSLSSYLKHDLIDWQYESGIRGKWNSLWMLPYHVNINGVIEEPVLLIPSSVNSDYQGNLKKGDKILAVDGSFVSGGYDILKALQKHYVSIIVKRSKIKNTESGINDRDSEFVSSFDFLKIKPILDSFGTSIPVTSSGEYVLLDPVVPGRWDEFELSPESREKMVRLQSIQQEEIAKIRNKSKRRKFLDLWENNQRKILLGISLKDRSVPYNPGAFAMLEEVFSESIRTLKALVTGNLSPKWLAGPVGIVQTLHYGWSLGLKEALFWMGLISVNLAVLNLMPIPVLDGGYVLICLWELISGKRLNLKLLERILGPFVLLMVLLFIFLTFQDLLRLFF